MGGHCEGCYCEIQKSVYKVSCKVKCAFKYGDDICVLDINECASSPCEHGATCTDAINSYTCRCVAGYKGTHCETGECFKRMEDIISSNLT